MKQKGEPYLVCNVYRPPNTPVSFWPRLNVIIEKALDSSKRIINRNHYLKELLNINNFYNIIHEPSRITPVSSTSLDVMTVFQNDRVLNSGTLPTDPTISDHLAVYMLIKFSYNHENTFKREVWNYKKG